MYNSSYHQIPLLRVHIGKDDGEYCILDVCYTDGTPIPERQCTCGAGINDLDAVPREHAKDCEYMNPRLTDAEWLEDFVHNGSGIAEELWADEEYGSPCKDDEFYVFGYMWYERDYWGECDEGFEFDHAETMDGEKSRWQPPIVEM